MKLKDTILKLYLHRSNIDYLEFILMQVTISKVIFNLHKRRLYNFIKVPVDPSRKKL